MKLKLLLTFLGFFAFLSYSQELESCGQAALTRMLWESNPELKANYYALENQLKEMDSPFTLRDGDEDEILPEDQVVTLPIVFHVLHQYGDENISDAQIYRAVEIMNKDYRKTNSDISEVVPEFVNIAGDSKIEFKLATMDPLGNPTNGITRHFTHETNIGDQFSKLDQWPRGRYINIWVSKFANQGGTAGYAFYPTDVEGELRFMDGVLILHGHVGDFGTASPYNSRSLTHEVGHYLNLAHPWGSTNDPALPQNCGMDDGVADTPNTIGSIVGVCNLGLTTCDDTLDNVQNFMDYSYCSVMYTKGQIKRMRNTLKLDVSNRFNLWQEENHQVSIPEGLTYDPVADFFVDNVTNKDRLVACVGTDVKFKNWSWRLTDGNNETYSWTFEDGNVSTSTDKNPTVSFTSPGWKNVSLTVEDNGRSHTVTKENFIWISPDWPVFSGNVHFTFDDNPDYWVIQNPSKQVYEWQVKSDAGVNGSGGIFLNTTSPYTNPTKFSNEYFHSQRRGGVKSAFVSQPIDLSYYSGNASVSFDFACATDGTNSDEISEQLEIYSSSDCGKTWQLRKKITGTQLVNNGSGWDSFYPNNTTVWSTESFDLLNSNLTSNMFLRFVYTGSDKSNNIAIDNIRIDGTLSTNEFDKESSLNVFPNPTDATKGWNIGYDPAEWGGATAELTDVSGRIVGVTTLNSGQSETNIKPNHVAAQGIYFLKVTNKERVFQSKLILK